jgi:hypothetical protein
MDRFIECYEAKMKEMQLLEILKDELTPKGKEIYLIVKEWLMQNLDRYLEAIDAKP